MGYANYTGAVLNLINGVSSAYNTKKAVQSDADYQQTINGANLVIAEASKDFNVKRIEDAKRKMLSSQRAASAVSGAMFDGSVAHVAVETTKQFNLDIFVEEFNYKVKEYESKVRQRELQLQKSNAQSAMVSGMLNTVSSSLSMASSSASTRQASGTVNINQSGATSNTGFDIGQSSSSGGIMTTFQRS